MTKSIESLRQREAQLQARAKDLRARRRRQERQRQDDRLRALGLYLENELMERREEWELLLPDLDAFLNTARYREAVGLPPTRAASLGTRQRRRLPWRDNIRRPPAFLMPVGHRIHRLQFISRRPHAGWPLPRDWPPKAVS